MLSRQENLFATDKEDPLGGVTIFEKELMIVIHSVFHFYGEAAGSEISQIMANDISTQWNEPEALIQLKKKWYRLRFDIEGKYRPDLTPEEVITNTLSENNYFRIEDFATGNISSVDGIGSNTGYFLKVNVLNHSTTAAHEYGHTLGLQHPGILDIRKKGTPGIMYPRGTLVDPEFQYDPKALPGMKGGTLNPFLRKVLLNDIEDLNIPELEFKNGESVIGEFSSVWHEAQPTPSG